LIELLPLTFVGEIGDVVPERDVGDLQDVEGESEMDPAVFKVGRDLAEGAWVSATPDAGSEMVPVEDEVGVCVSATSAVGKFSAGACGEDGVGVVSWDRGDVDLGDGMGVVRTRFPPSDIVIKSLATVDPGIELLMAGLLHILQKKFANLSPVLSCKRALLVE
jgi:hypothetical protein